VSNSSEYSIFEILLERYDTFDSTEAKEYLKFQFNCCVNGPCQSSTSIEVTEDNIQDIKDECASRDCLHYIEAVNSDMTIKISLKNRNILLSPMNNLGANTLVISGTNLSGGTTVQIPASSGTSDGITIDLKDFTWFTGTSKIYKASLNIKAAYK
jgi:hypothetical protein